MIHLFMLLLTLFLFPAIAVAELPKLVEEDFAVISGSLIMPVGEEYIVDLDDRDSLHEGDILTLVKVGRNVFHPETKEILGTTEIPIGFLQVTRVMSGYSYAKLLTDNLSPKNGARVKRFEQVPALFVDKQGNSQPLARQIMMDLPQFRWLTSDQVDMALLTFVMQDNMLNVVTTQGSSLHSYKITENLHIVAPSPSSKRPFVAGKVEPEPKLLEKISQSVLSMVNLADENPLTGGNVATIRQGLGRQEGLWMSPNINGSPIGIAVSDLDGDGHQETVVAFENKLLVFRVIEGKLKEVATIEIPRLLNAVSLDVIDLDRNGAPEIYVTAIGNYRPSSLVVEFTGQGYEVTDDGIRWLLRVVDLYAQGPVLLGQKMGQEEDFSGMPFIIQRENGRLHAGEKIDLPGLLSIYSFTSFMDDRGRLNYAHLTKDDHLKVVSSEGQELWESEEYYAGSENCFANREGHIGDSVIPFCVPQRLVFVPGQGLFVAQNDGQRLMQRYRKFKQSRLVSMAWNGFALEENWRSGNQQGYLGDFTLADADNDGISELVMAVKFQHKGVVDNARSSIVIKELN